MLNESLTEVVRGEGLGLTRLPVVHVRVIFIIVLVVLFGILRGVCGPQRAGRLLFDVGHVGEGV